jgi:protein farnesyltransferase subunit beta
VYHTLYCLSGLSAAQHHVYSSHARKAEALETWKDEGNFSYPQNWLCSDFLSDSPDNALRKAVFAELVSWTEEEGTSKIVGPSTSNRLVCHISS